MMRKRALANILCLVMVLCLMPTAAMAADTGKAIQLGTSGIEGPSATTNDEGTYYTPSSYIYFGVNGNSSAPIKWRVLDADKANDNSTPGMFLFSEHLLASGIMFDEDAFANNGQTNPNEWQHSDVQKWCKEFASDTSNFSDTEQAAMLGLAKTDSSGRLYGIDWGTSSLTDSDKMFFLSAHELSDYVGSYYGVGAGRWWLRSPDVGDTDIVGIVDHDWSVHLTGVEYSLEARPAFNIDSGSVLFTSAADESNNGGKGAGMSDLAAVPSYAGGEWKLTLKDSSRSGFTAETTAVTASTISIKYSGAQTGLNEWISAIIKDADGNITYYGRLKETSSDTDASGDINNINIDGKINEGDTLYVFNERCNGTNKTDYASAFATVALTVASVPLTITTDSLSEATVGTAYSQTLSATGNATITWSMKAGSGDLPAGLVLNGTTGEISGTPTAKGISTFTVVASDGIANDAEKEFSIVVKTPPSPGMTAPAPKAGDTSRPALLIGLALLALCGIAVTAVQRKKVGR